MILRILPNTTVTISSIELKKTLYVQTATLTVTATYYGTVKGLSVNYLPSFVGCLDNYPDTLWMIETKTVTEILTLTKVIIGTLRTIWNGIVTTIFGSHGRFVVNDSYAFGSAWSITSNTFNLVNVTITSTIKIG
ncbi:hypothetical protein IPA_02165 [Ignicoccus pacificus DSM 13166]|uniref:Uncharacterized protein n=1 Tax=Ignicoccus pacificus DSM 13166 TaxID=940294 RepID=A0A977PLB3_9CREN|nr:hypothetical protein IPA_02165 [Ignicoccus pacificus DSM 13166]